MDKEHEVVEETTTAEAEENQESTEQDEQQEETEEQTVDHAAELARLKAEEERKKEHNRLFAEKRLKSRGKLDDDEDDYEDERESIQDLVKKQVEEAKEATRLEVARYAVIDAIQRNSKSQAEAELAVYHYENSIRPTGNPKEDAETALLLANKSRYKQELSEVKRALMARDTKGNGAGAGQKATPKPKKQLTEREQRFIQAFGIKEQ